MMENASVKFFLMISHGKQLKEKHGSPLAFINFDMAKIMSVICSALHVFSFLILMILVSKLFFF